MANKRTKPGDILDWLTECVGEVQAGGYDGQQGIYGEEHGVTPPDEVPAWWTNEVYLDENYVRESDASLLVTDKNGDQFRVKVSRVRKSK